jgi:anti-sigma B factor antagonist
MTTASTATASPFIHIAPEGKRLDATNAAAFKARAVGALAQGTRAIVDLSQLQFLDSSGIGALVGIARHLGAEGELRLVVPNPQVRSLLSITRIDKILPVFNDAQSAEA